MKKYLKITSGTRVPFFAVGLLFVSFFMVSCGGGGGYGGGGGGGMTSAPGAFNLVSPISGVTVTTLTPMLTWEVSSGATGYYVYLTGGTFNNTLIATIPQPAMSPVSTMTSTLSSATTYTWQVTAYITYGGQTSATNGPASFKTQ